MIASALFLAIAAGGLVEFLIALLIIAVVVYGIHLVMGMITIHQNIKTLIWLIIGVIIIVALLNRFMGIGLY